MKNVSLILLLSVSPVMAAPSQQGKPASPQQTAVHPQRKGFFGSVKNFFKRPFEDRREVVAPVQTAQPQRVANRKRSSESSGSTANRQERNTREERSVARNERNERPTRNERPANREERSVARTERPRNDRANMLAPQSNPANTPSGMLAPVSNPTETANVAPTTSNASSVAAEFNRERYLKAKAEAARDPQVAALATKLEAAQPGEDYKAAARNYTKALFSKIREVDSSQNDWIERLEAATLRRIDEGKAIIVE